MITKQDIAIINMEINAKIYTFEKLKEDYELQILNRLMEGLNVDMFIGKVTEINKHIEGLKDIKLDANLKYNQQLINGDLSSIKSYGEKRKAIKERIG